MLNPFFVLRLLLVLACSVCSFQPVQAVAEEGAYIHPRVLLSSLSAADKKLPRDILIAQRQAEGKPVPAEWLASENVQKRAKSDGKSVNYYRVSGKDVADLKTVLSLVGATARTVSESHRYVVAALDNDQVISLSLFDAVTQIKRLKESVAQGTTEAWTAHRFEEIDEEGEPPNIVDESNQPIAPVLDGSDVVIAIISHPTYDDDLDRLVADGALPARFDGAASNDSRIYAYAGIPAGGTVALDALTNVEADGFTAGINLAQVVHDIAPGATIVLASPGGPDEADVADVALLIAELSAGRGDPGNPDADFIPAANIILDDLYFPGENPFAVGPIEEALSAVQAGSATGVMYFTAAGDGGHNVPQAGTANVIVENFTFEEANAVLWSEADNAISYSQDYSYHSFGGGDPYVTTAELLSDACFFWNQAPGTANGEFFLLLWEDKNTNGKIDIPAWADDDFAAKNEITDLGTGGVDPGQCLQQGSLPVGSKLLIGTASVNVTERFMLVGERSEPAFVDENGADDINIVFDYTTPGGIRGHAYSADVVTVGAAPYFVDQGETQPYWDSAAGDFSGTLQANTYSADGEVSSQRFFWKQDDQSQWQQVPLSSDLAAPLKPDLVAASAITVKVVDREVEPAVIQTEKFHGTSASVAVAAATAALYWDFRLWQVENAYVDEATQTDVRQALMASLRHPQNSWDRKLGFGVIDAPRTLTEPLPPTSLTLEEVSLGTLQLTYNKALNDLSASAGFVYSVDCTYVSDGAKAYDAPFNLEPADSDQGSVQAGTKVPIDITPPLSRIGEAVECVVETYEEDWGASTGEAGVSALTSQLLPPVVSMASASAGVTMQFEKSPSDDGSGSVDYTAACTRDNNVEIEDWPTQSGEVVPHSSESPSIYALAIDPGTTVECAVTASVVRDNNDAALTLTASGSALADALNPSATALTVTAAPGGVRASWVADPGLVSGVSAEVTLSCTQGGTSLVNQVVNGSSYFVEADQSAPVQCSVTTKIFGEGITTIDQSPVSDSNTPEPEEEVEAVGLPIWLIYIATQPQ